MQCYHGMVDFILRISCALSVAEKNYRIADLKKLAVL